MKSSTSAPAAFVSPFPLSLSRSSTVATHISPRRSPTVFATLQHVGLDSNSNPSSSSPSASSPSSNSTLSSLTLQRFLTWFRGEFDSYDQAASDRAPSSTLSRRQRHEHIHCRLQPMLHEGLLPAGEAAVFATYYYDGNPEIVYRRRLYSIHETGVQQESSGEAELEMLIYQMGFIHGLRVAKANCFLDDMDMGSVDNLEMYQLLEGSEILWRYSDGVYQGGDADGVGFTAPEQGHFVGTMRQGGYTAANGLRYEDELVMTKEDLWVGERVYNKDGVQVGGNPNGVPHKMRRIRPNDELKWTTNRDLPDVNIVPK